MSDNTVGGAQTRRRTIAMLGGSTLALSGCQGLLGGSGGGTGDEQTVHTESFESGLEESLFSDASQAASEAAVTDRHAADGQRALALASSPGTSSSCRALAAETWTGAWRYGVTVKPVSVGGPENSIGIRLAHDGSDRAVTVSSSGYHRETYYQATDESGEPVGSSEAPVGDQLPAGEWTRVEFTVRDGEVEVRVGARTLTVEPAWNVADYPVALRLHANAWGGGHPLTSAFDDVRIAEL